MRELETRRTTYTPEVLEAARREEERRLVREGTEIWRARKEEAARQKHRDQSELRRMLANYWPWGRPGGGAPCASALRKRNVPLEPPPTPGCTQVTPRPFQPSYYRSNYKIFSSDDCCNSSDFRPYPGCDDRFGVYRLVDAPAAGDGDNKRRKNFAAHGCLRRHVPDATRHGYEIDSWRSGGNREYISDLTEQMRQKQFRAMEEERRDGESNRRHFDTWRRFWGRPGHGAPLGLDRGALRRNNLHDILYRSSSNAGTVVTAVY